MAKGRIKTASVTTELVDHLAADLNGRVVVVIDNKKYGISETIKTGSGLILMVDETDDFPKAKDIIDDIEQSTGLPILIEVNGKALPVKSVEGYKRGIQINANVDSDLPYMDSEAKCKKKKKTTSKSEEYRVVFPDGADKGTINQVKSLIKDAVFSKDGKRMSTTTTDINEAFETIKDKIQGDVELVKLSIVSSKETDGSKSTTAVSFTQDKLVSVIQDWVGMDADEDAIESVLWALMMIDEDSAVCQYLKKARFEYEKGREEFDMTNSSIIAGICTQSYGDGATEQEEEEYEQGLGKPRGI